MRGASVWLVNWRSWFDRYMPNVKAPEYYKATGETRPVVPDVDEHTFLFKMLPPSERAPPNFNAVIQGKRQKKQKETESAVSESESSEGTARLSVTRLTELHFAEPAEPRQSWSELYDAAIESEESDLDGDLEASESINEELFTFKYSTEEDSDGTPTTPIQFYFTHYTDDDLEGLEGDDNDSDDDVAAAEAKRLPNGERGMNRTPDKAVNNSKRKKRVNAHRS